MIASMRAPTWGAKAIVVACTDHLGLQVRLQAMDANTLGVRMELEQPAQIPQESMDKAGEPTWWHTIQATLGGPPESW